MFVRKKKLPPTQSTPHTPTLSHTRTLPTPSRDLFSAGNIDSPSTSGINYSLETVYTRDGDVSDSKYDDISRVTGHKETRRAPTSTSSWRTSFAKLFSCCFKRNKLPSDLTTDFPSVTESSDDVSATELPSPSDVVVAEPTKRASFAARRREYLSSWSLSSTPHEDSTRDMKTRDMKTRLELVAEELDRSSCELDSKRSVRAESSSSVAAASRLPADPLRPRLTDAEPTPSCSHDYSAPTDTFSLADEPEASCAMETDRQAYHQLMTDEIARLEAKLAELHCDEVTLQSFHTTAEAVSHRLENQCQTESVHDVQDSVAAVADVRQELQTRAGHWFESFRSPVSASSSPPTQLVPDLCLSLAHRLNQLDKVDQPLTPRSYHDSSPSLSLHTPLPMSLPIIRSVSMPTLSSIDRPVFTPTFVSEGTSLSDVFRPRNYRFAFSSEDVSPFTQLAKGEEQVELEWEDEDGEHVELMFANADEVQTEMAREHVEQQMLVEGEDLVEMDEEVSDLEWETEMKSCF